MDTSAPDIRFDEAGVCSFCTEFAGRFRGMMSVTADERERRIAGFVRDVRRRGRGRRYDCIVGVSGGVDSSWVLVRAVALGLRPLAVHMDNGWNSELAQSNISNLIRALGVDLYTHVIEWNEYRRLMQAFFDANVLDIELLYDNAMLAVNYRLAAKFGVRVILGGTNQATEGMRMPAGWNWLKYDARQIRAIAKRHGAGRLRTFPTISTTGFLRYELLHGIRWRSFLDLFDYRKAEALTTLVREYRYQPYPYKHYESVFTRLYQGYLLPTKFGIEKRRLHLSTLIVSGQMTRDAALQDLAGIGYPSEAALARDVRYFLKKMRWQAADLERYLAAPAVDHASYPSERALWDALAAVYRRFGGSSGRTEGLV